ncbi:MAG: hypothetical protein GY720_16480 [bacterium]|nr:hypothetical protein [bacterium]
MLWLSILGAAVLVAACGGGAFEESGTTIVSPDGMATLVIPEGSLPDDVSVDEVEVEWTEVVSEEPGAPFSTVMLTPSGLTLSEAATLRVEIPDTVDQLMAVHSSADGFEFVGAGLEATGDKLVATIALADFSFVSIYEAEILLVTASATPSPVTVGETQSVSMEMEVFDTYVPVWIQLGDRDKPEYQLYEFQIEAVRVANGFLAPEVDWREPSAVGLGDLSPNWSPSRVEAELAKDKLSVAMFASSQCKSAADDKSLASGWMAVDMSLAAKGEILDGSTLGMKTLLDKTGRDTYVSDVRPGDRSNYEIEVGKTVSMIPFISRVQAAKCVAAPGTDDSTTTSTLPPAEQGASFKLIGSAGDISCEDPNDTYDPALTITGATFVQEGDEIVVTITFDGDAEAHENATTDTFPVAVQFRLKEGGPYPEAFFGEKGKLKVSGGLLQIVSHEFSGDTLTLRLKGRTLEDVQGVQVSTFVHAGGSCVDLLYSDGYND